MDEVLLSNDLGTPNEAKKFLKRTEGIDDKENLEKSHKYDERRKSKSVSQEVQQKRDSSRKMDEVLLSNELGTPNGAKKLLKRTEGSDDEENLEKSHKYDERRKSKSVSQEVQQKRDSSRKMDEVLLSNELGTPNEAKKFLKRTEGSDDKENLEKSHKYDERRKSKSVSQEVQQKRDSSRKMDEVLLSNDLGTPNGGKKFLKRTEGSDDEENLEKSHKYDERRKSKSVSQEVQQKRDSSRKMDEVLLSNDLGTPNGGKKLLKRTEGSDDKVNLEKSHKYDERRKSKSVSQEVQQKRDSSRKSKDFKDKNIDKKDTEVLKTTNPNVKQNSQNEWDPFTDTPKEKKKNKTKSLEKRTEVSSGKIFKEEPDDGDFLSIQKEGKHKKSKTGDGINKNQVAKEKEKSTPGRYKISKTDQESDENKESITGNVIENKEKSHSIEREKANEKRKSKSKSGECKAKNHFSFENLKDESDDDDVFLIDQKETQEKSAQKLKEEPEEQDFVTAKKDVKRKRSEIEDVERMPSLKKKKKMKTENKENEVQLIKEEDDMQHIKKKKEKELKDQPKKEKSEGNKTPKKKKTKEERDAAADLKAKQKEEEEKQLWKWWEEQKYEDGIKWMFLEHKGPVFAPPYEPLPDNVKFYYDGITINNAEQLWTLPPLLYMLTSLWGGKQLKLSVAAEEVASFFAKMLDHEYTTKDVFRNNFFIDWRKNLPFPPPSTQKTSVFGVPADLSPGRSVSTPGVGLVRDYPYHHGLSHLVPVKPLMRQLRF